ncbi:hypothetical protein B566_EDAN012479 [Ephemera danica]|nr:hypothetical protein B566_EDAN012479 [Ephemera danica]
MIVVVLACEDGGCYGYSLISGKLTHSFQGHRAAVTVVCGVQANPEDTKFELCSGSIDEHLCLFDSETQCIVSKHYLASTVTCLEKEQDRVLYVGLQCGQILKYDLQVGVASPTGLAHNNCSVPICGLDIRHDRFSLDHRSPCSVLLFTGLLLRTFVSTTNERSFSLAIYADRLFSGATKYSVPVFDLLSGDNVNELAVDGTVSCIQHYKHLLFVASYNGRVFVFDLRVITCSRSKAMISVAFPKEVAENLKAACTCCAAQC